MGVTYTRDGDVIRFSTSGKFTLAEGLAVLRAGLDSLPPSPPQHLLFDIRQTLENRTPDELRSAVDVIAAARPKLSGRVALLVASTFNFAVARMFGVFLEGLGFKVLVTWTEADMPGFFAAAPPAPVRPAGPNGASPTVTSGS